MGNNNGNITCILLILTDCDMKTWETLFRLNVFAVGICCREALKSMKERNVDDGHIINVSRCVIFILNNSEQIILCGYSVFLTE